MKEGTTPNTEGRPANVQRVALDAHRSTDEIRRRQDRWDRATRRESPPGFLFLVRCADPDQPPRPPLWPDRKQERIEWIWGDYQRQMRRAAWLDDDAVPHLNMLTGTEIFAEAFGCRVHRPSDNMPFALPLIHSAAEVDRIRVPELSASSLAYLFDMAGELQRRAPEAVFRLPDVQSPMDIAALILEKTAFFTALIESPDALRELAGKVRALLTAFLDEWFRRYGTRYVAHYPDYFMTGGMTLSEDEVGAVNPEMFDEFFLPELAALSQRYGGIGMHCCANARHQWPGFLRIPNLRVLNICQPLEVATATYPFFGRGPLHWHGNIASGPVETWPRQYPAEARFVIETQAQTPEDARRVAGALHEQRVMSRARKEGRTCLREA
jgi:hypothetical protein